MKYLGGIVNLSINGFTIFISIIFITSFKKLYKQNKEIELTDLENSNELKPNVTFKDGINYLLSNKKFVILISVNALIYYIYGIIEIINYKLGFEDYDILLLSLVLGFSTTGTIILYFYKNASHKYFINYFILLISCVIYFIVEHKHIIPIWFLGLWLFSYTHYAYWIMINTILQTETNEQYRGRIFTYNSSIVYASYAIGSLSGSYLYPYYWIIIMVMNVIIGVLIKCYNIIE